MIQPVSGSAKISAYSSRWESFASTRSHGFVSAARSGTGFIQRHTSLSTARPRMVMPKDLCHAERLQLREPQGQAVGAHADHPLVDDQQHDDPVQSPGDRTPGPRGVTNAHVVKLAAEAGQGQSHGSAGTHHEYVAIGARFPSGSLFALVLWGLGACQTSPPAAGSAARDSAAFRGRRHTRRRARVPGGRRRTRYCRSWCIAAARWRASATIT